MSKEIVLAGGVRTAIGSFSGAFSELPAPRLGSAVAAGAIDRSGVSPEQFDEVLFGNVLSAGLGQNVARQVGVGAGLPPRVGATTVSKVCGSGLKSVMLAAQAIQCGDSEVVLAGGVENMSRSPYLLEKARQGHRLGHGELVDSLIRDGLWDAYHDRHMGTCGDRCAARQDDFAVRSYQKALAAQESGAFSGEILPVDAPAGRDIRRVNRDEEPGRFDETKLRRLQPAFGTEGTVTAGNASSINDGAAAVVVLSGAAADAGGVSVQGRILGCASEAREPEWFTLAPIGAIRTLLDRIGLSVDHVDLFEINEAFAGVPMAAQEELGIPDEKLNVHGGAIALGHPIGASGARVLVTLLHAMRTKGAKTGIGALCIGGGEAVAVAVESR